MRMQFDITLQAKFWNKSPDILIILNGEVVAKENNFINNEDKKIKFEAQLDEGAHQLTIHRQNKSVKDTVLENSEIIKDSIVQLSDIVIDKISIEPLLDKGTFFPQYPEPWLSQQKQKGETPPTQYNYCRTLHHNGEWKLNFTNPIHVWFFQNISVEI